MAAVGGHRGSAAADRLCQACVDLLSVDAAAISLVFDGVNTGTLGASSEKARQYDELQFTVGEGPCLESVASRAFIASCRAKMRMSLKMSQTPRDLAMRTSALVLHLNSSSNF